MSVVKVNNKVLQNIKSDQSKIFIRQTGDENNKDYICIYNIEKITDFNKDTLIIITSRGNTLRWVYKNQKAKESDLNKFVNMLR